MRDKLSEYQQTLLCKHWWFKGRAKILSSFLTKHAQKEEKLEILEIGSGFGAFVPILKNFGAVDVIEPFKDAHPLLRKRGASYVYDIDNFPEVHPETKYDMVTLFDFLEHADDDLEALEIVKDFMLKNNGKIVITVPTKPSPWSDYNSQNRNRRLYSPKKINALLEKAGYKNIETSYFMTILFPYVFICTFLEKIHKKPGKSRYIPTPIINGILYTIYGLESLIIRTFSLPFGLSLIVKAEM